MSQYSHDLRKFADTGLQLRLPVDLIPPNQYGQLTNALPVIEGEIRTREGLTAVSQMFPGFAVTTLQRPTTVSPDATIASTAYAANLVAGQQVDISVIASDPTSSSGVAIGSYLVTVVTPLTLLTFQFTPAIPVAWASGAVLVGVFAQLRIQNVQSVSYPVGISNIFRLNQALPTLDTQRIIGMAGRLFTYDPNNTPPLYELLHPTVPNVPPTLPNNLSGGTLSIISYRFTDDIASWALIADDNVMYKYRPTGLPVPNNYYFWLLGNPAPLTQATASAGGVGQLNSTGGTNYDWRYTYHDGVVNTEGNPSPISASTPPTILRPTAFQNPAPGITGSLAVANPGNAIDGTDAHTMVCSAEVERLGGNFGVDKGFTSVLYTGAASSGAGSQVTLNIDYLVNYSSSGSTNGMSVQVQVSYSVNGGSSFTPFLRWSSAVARTTTSAELPAGTDAANVQVLVRSTATGTGGAAGNISIDIDVYDINFSVVTSSGISSLALVNQQALVCCQLPGGLNDGRIQNIRLYRRGGSLPDAWRLVGTFPLLSLTQGGCGTGSVQITDNVGDTQLSSQPILELDNDPPVTSVSTTNQALNFIWGPAGLEARVLGCGDPNRPECVYFSKPGNPDAWPPENFLEVSEPGTPIIAGCIFNNQSYAFSREHIYSLVEGVIAGATYTPFTTPSAHGLYSPWGLAIGPAMYFIAKDGIYASTGGQEQSLVENDIKPIFPTYDTPGQSVGPYEAVDMDFPDNMRLRYHNDELYFSYIGISGTRQLLVYDILKHRWRGVAYSVGISELYSEPSTVSSLLLGSTGGTFYQPSGNLDPTEFEVLEFCALATTSVANTLPFSGNFYAQVGRTTAVGEIALSPILGPIVVNPTTSPLVTIQTAPAPQGNTLSWRIHFGQFPTVLNQYVDVSEGSMPPGRVVTVTAPGTPGAVPASNPNFQIPVTLRTGAHDQGVPLNNKQYGNVIFDLNPNNAGTGIATPIEIEAFINGEANAAALLSVSGNGRQQVPLDLTDYFAFNTEYQVSWTCTQLPDGTVVQPTLFQYDTLHFIEPVLVTHWQTAPTSFGFPGYLHCRDCYIAIRSTADAVLTMTIDGVITQAYTIPSTGGHKLKQYIPFASNKGLVYRFSVDCPQQFKLYEQDLEIRVKPWLGVLGYAVQRVLGGEAGA